MRPRHVPILMQPREPESVMTCEGKGPHRQLCHLLHGLAAGQTGVVGGTAGYEHKAAAALNRGIVVHQAPQHDALQMVGLPWHLVPLR